MKDNIKEISILVTGFLSALMGFLATLNIEFQWLSEASINAFGVFLVATIVLIVAVYSIYKNTFVVTKKAKMQKEELKRKGLK